MQLDRVRNRFEFLTLFCRLTERSFVIFTGDLSELLFGDPAHLHRITNSGLIPHFHAVPKLYFYCNSCYVPW